MNMVTVSNVQLRINTIQIELHELTMVKYTILVSNQISNSLNIEIFASIEFYDRPLLISMRSNCSFQFICYPND